MKNSNMDSSLLPEVGKVYYFYDDGNISVTRQYRVRVKEIIPFSEAKNRVYCVNGKDILTQLNEYNFEAPTYDKIWENAKEEYDWIFTGDTEYIVIGEFIDNNPSWKTNENYDMLFGISEYGWYTFDDYYNGILDVDWHLTKGLYPQVTELFPVIGEIDDVV